MRFGLGYEWLREWAFLLAFCKAIYGILQLMLCKNLRSPLKQFTKLFLNAVSNPTHTTFNKTKNG